MLALDPLRQRGLKSGIATIQSINVRSSTRSMYHASGYLSESEIVVNSRPRNAKKLKSMAPTT